MGDPQEHFTTAHEHLKVAHEKQKAKLDARKDRYRSRQKRKGWRIFTKGMGLTKKQAKEIYDDAYEWEAGDRELFFVLDEVEYSMTHYQGKVQRIRLYDRVTKYNTRSSTGVFDIHTVSDLVKQLERINDQRAKLQGLGEEHPQAL